MKPEYPNHLKVAFALVGFLFAASAGFLVWAAWTGSATTSAALAAAGVLLTQTVAFLGLLQRQASDVKTTKESALNHDRLRVETALRAVESLVGSGEAYVQTRNGGAIVALAELGQIDLSLALLDVMWPGHEVGPEAAIQVINAAMDAGDESTVTSAASILAENAASTFPPESSLYHFPHALLTDWDPDLPDDARFSLLTYVVSVIDYLTSDLSRPATEACGYLEPAVTALNSLRDSDESSETYKNVAVASLKALMPVYRRSKLESMPGPGGAQIAIDEYAEQLDEAALAIQTINAVLYGKIQRIAARVLTVADSQP